MPEKVQVPVKQFHLDDSESSKKRVGGRRASEGYVVLPKEANEMAQGQNERFIEFFKESLIKFKQEKHAEITSELFVIFALCMMKLLTISL